MTCMLELDPALLVGDDSWRLVLGAYHANQTEQKAQNPETDGWLPRLRSVEGIEGEALARAHGQLIALGFLKFELMGREDGMRYQVSSLGKRTIEHGGRSSEDGEGSSDTEDDSPSEHQPAEELSLEPESDAA